ncbi:MAG: hypothetical protein P4L69_18335 [Desulfosporosinus sp.]|nr:hypothetical protein [Desulfosporosinus sp.]
MWARVENGVVIEIINFDPTGCFTDEIVTQFILCPAGTHQGWLYANGTFTALTPPVAEVQPPTTTDRLAAVEAAITALMGV